MPAPPHIDRHTFLTRLRQSGLFTREQFDALVGWLPATERGRVIARALVADGWLTRFQAEQLLAGRTGGFLVGPYRILDQLGQGGMGRVFKAEHQLLGRIVALKVLAPSLVRSRRGQKLFLREVRAAARLIHPNIVSAHDAGQDGVRHYLVMEFVDGPNLDQLVRSQGPLPVGQACDFVRQVAEGLAFASSRGMVHRDIKPANILVQLRPSNGLGAGVAKISDFGLARLSDRSPRGGDSAGTILARGNTVLGTPDYIAPEQARDIHGADIRSDLYSLGCTFYYLLTAQVPFPGDNTLEKLVRHAVEEAPAVEKLRPDVPEPVAAILRQMMTKEPARRFQTPLELVTALAPHCAGVPLPQTLPSSDPFFDRLATPDGGSGPGASSDGGADEGASALADSTVAAGAMSTSLDGEKLPALAATLAWRPSGPSRRRWVIALLVAAASAVGLLAGATASWLFSGR